MRRSLAISSEGMLSDSARRTLTFLSLGMLAVTLAPETEEERRRRRGAGGWIRRSKPRRRDNRREKEEAEILSIIRTFILIQE